MITVKNTLLAAASALCSSVVSADLDVALENWSEVKAPHFHLVGNVKPQKLKALAQEFENFRHMSAQLSNIKLDAKEQPMKVFVVKGNQTFSDLKTSKENGSFGQYYLTQKGSQVIGARQFSTKLKPQIQPKFTHVSTGVNGNYMVLNEAPLVSGKGVKSGFAKEAFYTQYFDQMLNRYSKAEYPAWFKTGYAEYMATMTVPAQDKVVVGTASNMRIDEIDGSLWTDVSALVKADSLAPRNNHVPHAQAWALVHYLQQQPGSEENFAGYLQAVRSGQDATLAFSNNFGVKPKALNSKLKSYVEKGHYTRVHASMPVASPEYDLVANSLSADEVAVEVGKLWQHTHADKTLAKQAFETAAAMNVNNVAALAGLSMVNRELGHEQMANQQLSQAEALDASDINVKMAKAQQLHEQALVARNQGGDWQAKIQQARGLYDQVFEQDSNMTAAVYFYAKSFAEFEQDRAKAIGMMEYLSQANPGLDAVNKTLAELYAANGQSDKAKDIQRKWLAAL